MLLGNMELYFILFSAGIMSGFLTVLFGFGGGFIVVPLVYQGIRWHTAPELLSYQFAFKSAIATSLLLMVFNAGLTSYKQHQQGRLQYRYIFPMAYWVAIGAMLGGGLSVVLSATVLKWAFFLYVFVTLIDCLLRQHHRRSVMTNARQKPLKPLQQRLAGTLIGTIAAALGVGGSVLTVPLFRRCGIAMTDAVALANPLSLVVAVAGTLSCCAAYLRAPLDLGPHFIGYFYYPAVLCLISGGFMGIKLMLPWVTKISQQTHERAYMILLALVLCSVLYR